MPLQKIHHRLIAGCFGGVSQWWRFLLEARILTWRSTCTTSELDK